MMWLHDLDVRAVEFFAKEESVKLRAGARSGLWCMLVLPAALLLSAIRYHDHVGTVYQMTAMCSMMTALFLLMKTLDLKPLFGFLLVIVNFCVLFTLCDYDIKLTVSVSTLMVVLSGAAFSLVIVLLQKFPCAFSVGEVMLVTEGLILLIFSTALHLISHTFNESGLISQIQLVGIAGYVTCLMSTPALREPVPFLSSLIVAVLLTSLLLTMLLGENPISWLIIFISFPSLRLFLLFYWAACSVVGIFIVWEFRNSRMSLTILRKLFHALVLAIYLPGALFDAEFLRLASTVALSAFIIIEAVRICNVEPIGPLLDQSLSSFQDDKDQGAIILSHIYLLVGCSLPIWILPTHTTSEAIDLLLLSSGVISLGVGDAAASIGGTLLGKTKLGRCNKSVEGTLCSIVAQLMFVLALDYLGFFGLSPVPWIRFIVAATVTSLVEAFTTQVDNLVLPLIMYVFLVV